MKTYAIVLGVVIAVLAIAAVTIPQFTNCDYNGKSIALANGKTTPMKCLWTARAEIAAGIPLMAVGIMFAASRRKETQRYLGIAGLVLGAFVVALPTNLIGVCSSQMPCNTIMEPSLQAIGGVAMAASALGIVLAQKAKLD